MRASDSLTVLVLGSGTGVATKQRAGAGYLVSHQRYSALVDCGNGVLRRMVDAGRHPEELDVVLITHTHPDHLSDLVPLLHHLVLCSRQRPLEVYGPPGFTRIWETQVLPLAGGSTPFGCRVREVLGQPEENDESPKLISLEGFPADGIEVTAAPTRHSQRLPSRAYRFATARQSVVFSGDAEDDPVLRQLATGVDLLVADCSYPDAEKISGHMSASECGRCAAAAGARALLLSHLYPVHKGDERRLAEARNQFSGRVLLAHDLMELSIDELSSD